MIQDVVTVLPLIILTLGAFGLLLLEVFVRSGKHRGTFAIGVLIAGLAATIYVRDDYGRSPTIFNGIFFADPFTWFFTILLVCGTIVSFLLTAGKLKGQGIEAEAEFYALFIMSTVGAILFVASAELTTMFLSLEIMSMSLYCLCGSALGRRNSSESALKYFLLGSFSSAFLLYGIALLYGITGSTSITVIAEALSTSADPVIVPFALGLTMIGLVFKLGAVPFHFWVPDVYQGAPTSVTAYMACVIKASAVGAAIRILWILFGNVSELWVGAVWVIALLTMLMGNLIAVRQRDVKRMLAYSSIAHAGYLCSALLVPSNQFGGGSAIMYYLIAYSVMTLGSFGVVLAVAGYDESGKGSDITNFVGLGSRHPGLAAAMSIFLLALAGLPPGMAGLVGKFYVFSALVKGEYIGLAVVGVLTSAISCYYYLKVIVAMYFTPVTEEKADTVVLDTSLASGLFICVLGVVLCGIFPGYFYERAAIIMNSLLPQSL